MSQTTVIAVDWSGRRDGTEREAMWCAEVVESDLVRLTNGRSRSELMASIIDTAKNNPRLVLGLDFAFGFPAVGTRAGVRRCRARVADDAQRRPAAALRAQAAVLGRCRLKPTVPRPALSRHRSTPAGRRPAAQVHLPAQRTE